MNEQKQRKTDRRTLYTRMVVKEALLELLSEMDYADITVATLCRKAEINRGTFYLHYGNLSQVMDELFLPMHLAAYTVCFSRLDVQRRQKKNAPIRSADS